MARKAFEKELEDLSDEVAKMAKLAVESITLAVKSFVDIDVQTAKKVFDIDLQLYKMDLEIEKKCLDLIALQTPVARDLRTIGTCLKIITNLDRIGRYAADISEVTINIAEKTHFKKLVSIQMMANITVSMVTNAVQSFIDRDISLVKKIFSDEESVDALYEEIFREVLTYMIEDPKTISLGIQYILVARYLERIADHACSIAERVVYMVKGERVHLKMRARSG
ncbi:MAG: phosphate signaling complex protein PhoU [Thermoplasmata archaeon]